MTFLACCLIWVPIVWGLCEMGLREWRWEYLRRDWGRLQWRVLCCRLMYSKRWYVRKFADVVWYWL